MRWRTGDCRACGLGDPALPRCDGLGPDDAEVAVVGIAPSIRAATRAVGAFGIPELACSRGSARAFAALAELAGLDLKRIYSTNALKCATPGNRAPTPAEVDNCLRNHLRKELEALPNLRTVLVFGRVAGAALGLSDFGIRRTVEGTTAEATLLRHPNSTLRKWTNLRRDAAAIRRALGPAPLS